MSNQQHEAQASIHEHTNRLIHETSPYLLQHAHNPVDWYSWEPEAFEKAKSEDKPILLSVGYAACHWCHRLREESFENEDTARLMNDNFVSIKVDREERPDVDALYMDAVQALTGSGGWPMTVFLTPDGAPFYAGTYFPPQDRYGMPGFPTLLRNIAAIYRDRHDDIEQQAAEFRNFYRQRSEIRLTLPDTLLSGAATVDPNVLHQAEDRTLAQMDAVNGGFGRAPKFPHPMGLEFLLRMLSRSTTGSPPSRDVGASGIRPEGLGLVRLTLDKMADGGIYDQIGGGFHRYATDAIWLVPHFEKMLYDNALLASTYLHAYQLTGEPRYRRVCEETLDYVLREMTDPAGGFYSTQDADSEGEEGKFYLWTPAELHAILDPAEAELAEDLWGVTERGNFEGANILHVTRPMATIAAEYDLSEPQLRDAVDRIRRKLYDARTKRIWPAKDDKVLAAWNGLMLRALSEAARALDRSDYRDAVRANARFITEHMVVASHLRRSWRNGQPRLDAYLEDYGAVVNGLLSAYEATGDVPLFQQARAHADTMLDLFWNDDAVAFFDTARDAEQLIGRPRELTDNATPSGTSLAAEALLRLAAFTGEDRYRRHAIRAIVPLVPAMADSPSAFGHLLCALDDLIGPFYEVAVIGEPDSPERAALLNAVSTHFLPRIALAFAAPNDSAAASAIPLLADRGLVQGKSAAYVCRGFVCRQPVTEPDALLAELAP